VLVASFVHSLVHIGIPISEKLFRTIVVYLAIATLLRMFGRRTAAQLNSFDLVVLLLLSNVVQNAIIGPDNSLVGGLIGAAVLVLVNDGIVRVLRRNDRFDRRLEGTETHLVKDGRYVTEQLRRLGIRPSDLEVALHRQGAENVQQVRSADLYPSGALVVDMQPEARDAVTGDIERLERKLDQILNAIQASS
jgi:uncharacterized membrane protein YcaP (DUF421 family)